MKNKIKRTIIAGLLVSTLVPSLAMAQSSTKLNSIQESGVKYNQMLDVARQKFNKPTQIKPFQVNTIGEFYKFDRNNPNLKDVTSQEYDSMLYKCDQDTTTKMKIWDGSDVYNPKFTIMGMSKFGIDYRVPQIVNLEYMGAKDDELAYFVPIYAELENGEKVNINDSILTMNISQTYPTKTTNIFNRKIKRIVFKNTRNVFERLIINVDIKTPENKLPENIIHKSFITGELQDNTGAWIKPQ